jgi:alanyl-tRNA synthetase
VELCGGTHARATGDIGMLKVISEQGVAAGVRRITATSGAGALKYLRELEHTLERAAELTKAGNLDLPTRIEKMLANERALEKKLAETQKKLVTGNAQGGVDALLSQAREYNGIKVLSVRCEVTERAALRELAEQLRDRLGPSVVLVASQADGNAQLVLTVAKALTSKLQAGQLIRPIAEIVGGSGGGRPDLAQAGGTQPQHIDDAVQALHTLVEPLARAL